MTAMMIDRPTNRAGKYGRAFTIDDVRTIRRLAREGWTPLMLAKSYCVGRATIERLLSGATYGWVPDTGKAEVELTQEQLQARADASFARFEELMAKPQEVVKERSVLEILGSKTAKVTGVADVPRVQPVKRYHPLLAQGWRYCDGQLCSPEDIEALNLTPDEDQSEEAQHKEVGAK